MSKRIFKLRIDEDVIRKIDKSYGKENREHMVENLLKVGFFHTPH